MKAIEDVIEDELLLLWNASGDMTHERFMQLAPSVAGFISPHIDGAGALWAFQLLLRDLEGRTKELDAAISVLLRIPKTAPVQYQDDRSIDQRLSDVAVLTDKGRGESSRSARRWARKGIEQLAELIIALNDEAPMLYIELTQPTEDSFLVTVEYDPDEYEYRLSAAFMHLNGTPLYRVMGEQAFRAEIPGEPDETGLFHCQVWWIAERPPRLSVSTELLPHYTSFLTTDARSVWLRAKRGVS